MFQSPAAQRESQEGREPELSPEASRGDQEAAVTKARGNLLARQTVLGRRQESAVSSALAAQAT